MKKILSAIAVAASANLPAFAALDPDCVLYYDFETMAEDGYKVENIANPGVMQLSGGEQGPCDRCRCDARCEDSPDAYGNSRRRFLQGAPLYL